MSICSYHLLAYVALMAKRRKTRPIPRKSPEQDRSRATVEAILEAAAHILIADGYGLLTTNHVAERAGVSIGSLYQYFPNKESLLGELMRRHTLAIEEGIEASAPKAQEPPFANVVRAAIEQIVQVHLVDPELHRALSEAPPLGKLDWQAMFAGRLTARVKAVFEAHRSEITAPDLDLAAYVVLQAVEAVVHNAATERLSDLESGVLTDEVTRLVVGYLTGDAAPPKRSQRGSR